MLDHERLDVYRCALELVALGLDVAQHVPRGFTPLADQLRRASASIPLNIAEGAGKFSLADRGNFYRIARGSALECGAALDVIGLARATQQSKVQAGKILVERIVSMLTKLASR